MVVAYTAMKERVAYTALEETVAYIALGLWLRIMRWQEGCLYCPGRGWVAYTTSWRLVHTTFFIISSAYDNTMKVQRRPY